MSESTLTPGAAPVQAAAPATAPVVTPGAQSVQPAPAPQPAVTPAPAPAAQAAPAAPAAEPAFLDFGGRKVNPTDAAAVKAAADDYQRLQAQYTRSQQELLKYKQMGAPAQAAPPQQAAAQEQTTQAQMAQAASELGITPEQLNQALFTEGDAAFQAISKLAEVKARTISEQVVAQKIAEALQPVTQFQQQYTIDQHMDAMAARYPDFNHPDMLQRMTAEFDRVPALHQLPPDVALEMAYRSVKASTPSAQAPAPAPTVEDLLADPQRVARLAQDPRIRTLIEQENLQKASQVQSALPPVLAGQTPGAPPVLPANKSQSVGDATKNWLSRLAAGAVGR